MAVKFVMCLLLACYIDFKEVESAKLQALPLRKYTYLESKQHHNYYYIRV